jgi:hypothetical protein
MATLEAHVVSQDLSSTPSSEKEDIPHHPTVSKILDLMNDDKIFQAYREEQVCFCSIRSQHPARKFIWCVFTLQQNDNWAVFFRIFSKSSRVRTGRTSRCLNLFLQSLRKPTEFNTTWIAWKGEYRMRDACRNNKHCLRALSARMVCIFIRISCYHEKRIENEESSSCDRLNRGINLTVIWFPLHTCMLRIYVSYENKQNAMSHNATRNTTTLWEILHELGVHLTHARLHRLAPTKTFNTYQACTCSGKQKVFFYIFVHVRTHTGYVLLG